MPDTFDQSVFYTLRILKHWEGREKRDIQRDAAAKRQLYFVGLF